MTEPKIAVTVAPATGKTADGVLIGASPAVTLIPGPANGGGVREQLLAKTQM
jgi:hypothetical protein